MKFDFDESRSSEEIRALLQDLLDSKRVVSSRHHVSYKDKPMSPFTKSWSEREPVINCFYILPHEILKLGEEIAHWLQKNSPYGNEVFLPKLWLAASDLSLSDRVGLYWSPTRKAYTFVEYFLAHDKSANRVNIKLKTSTGKELVIPLPLKDITMVCPLSKHVFFSPVK